MKTANRATNLIQSLSLLVALSGTMAVSTAQAQTNSAVPWVTIFNGKDLTGWTIKIDPTPWKWTGGIFADYGANWEWYYSLENDSRAREAFKLGEWNIFRVEALGKVLKVWVNGVPATHLVHGKYKEGYIAFKIHSLPDKPDDPNLLGHFRNIRIIAENPASCAQPMDLLAKIVE